MVLEPGHSQNREDLTPLPSQQGRGGTDPDREASLGHEWLKMKSEPPLSGGQSQKKLPREIPSPCPEKSQQILNKGKNFSLNRLKKHEFKESICIHYSSSLFVTAFT